MARELLVTPEPYVIALFRAVGDDADVEGSIIHRASADTPELHVAEVGAQCCLETRLGEEVDVSAFEQMPRHQAVARSGWYCAAIGHSDYYSFCGYSDHVLDRHPVIRDVFEDFRAEHRARASGWDRRRESAVIERYRTLHGRRNRRALGEFQTEDHRSL